MNYIEINEGLNMDSIVINATIDTPKVICSDDGTLSIFGRSLIENPIDFYKPILDWVKHINVENIEIIIRLEYMNTSSSMQIYNLLEQAKKNQWKKSVMVKWFYDVNDEDGIELGKEFESMLEMPFQFYNFLDL